MSIWRKLFGSSSKPPTTADSPKPPAPQSQQKVKSTFDIFKDVYGPIDQAAADKALDEIHKRKGYKRCYVCARIACRPDFDGYLESDLAGKPTGIHRAGAKHLERAERLAALAYATVHALSIGPKSKFGRWICSDCVSDYWGVIYRADETTRTPSNVEFIE